MEKYRTKTELKQLGRFIKNAIEGKKADGLISPENETFFRWGLKDFNYGPKGAESSAADGETFTKSSWFHASRIISEEIKKSSEYQSVLKILKAAYKDKGNLEQALSQFIEKLIHRFLYRGGSGAEDFIVSLSQRLIDDLDGKPARFGAEIVFQGITLESKRVDLPAVGILLRQPTRSDLEKERPHWALLSQPHLVHPSAIAELSFQGHHGRDIQLRVEKLTAILRLFKVGSVKHFSYQMNSESLLDTAAYGGIISGGLLVALETSYIKKTDRRKLGAFIRTLNPILPDKFYQFGEGEVLPVTIAFDRYNDALLRVSIVEERIANAIMGLEALLIDDTRELSYRLRTLTAKAMSALGRDPEKVRVLLNDAYRIRSLFTHGEHLTDKERKKFEEKYGEVKTILLEVLDCLRCLIVVSLVSKKTKRELIQLLEDSLLTKQANRDLGGTFAPVKRLV